MSPGRRALLAAALLAGAYAASLVAVRALAPDHPLPGFPEGCGAPTNCSRVADTRVRAEGLAPPRLGTSVEGAQAAVLAWVRAQPRSAVLVDEPGFVHAVFRSATFRFPDDVAVRVFCGGGEAVAWVQSEARLGRGDFGVNDRRVRALVEHLEAAEVPATPCA